MHLDDFDVSPEPLSRTPAQFSWGRDLAWSFTCRIFPEPTRAEERATSRMTCIPRETAELKLHPYWIWSSLLPLTTNDKLKPFKRWLMLVVMQAHATDEQVRAVCRKIESLGYRAHAMPGAQRTAIGITGNQSEVEPGTLEEMAGVQELIRVSKPYKLVSRDVKQDNTVIRFRDSNASFGGPGLAIVAGPCAIESREQAMAIGERVSRAGAQFFRGGAY